MFTKAVEEGKPEGFWGGVLGEVVEEIAKGRGEEGKGRAVVLWFVSIFFAFELGWRERGRN